MRGSRHVHRTGDRHRRAATPAATREKQDYTDEARAAATTRVYRAAWAGFAAWCGDSAWQRTRASTTKLYDKSDQVGLDEVERIII
jgi:hypothetical protein